MSADGNNNEVLEHRSGAALTADDKRIVAEGGLKYNKTELVKQASETLERVQAQQAECWQIIAQGVEKHHFASLEEFESFYQSYTGTLDRDGLLSDARCVRLVYAVERGMACQQAEAELMKVIGEMSQVGVDATTYAERVIAQQQEALDSHAFAMEKALATERVVAELKESELPEVASAVLAEMCTVLYPFHLKMRTTRLELSENYQ